MTFVPLRPTEDALVAIGSLDDDAKDDFVKNCVQAVIVLSQNKSPIKRVDLNRLALPTNYRISAAIIQLANRELYKTFGMRLFELEDRKKFLLVNAKTDFAQHMTFSDEECEEMTVLYFILMDIFVSPDEKIRDDEIEKSLRPLNYTSETIKSYVDTFVKRLYLTQARHHDSLLFSWGPRAVAEVEPERFFECFLELSGNTNQKDWPEIKKRIDKMKSMPNR